MFSADHIKYYVVIIAFFVFSCTGCQREPQTVRVNIFKKLMDMPITYGSHQDYYLDENLQLEYHEVTGGDEAVELLSRGELDIGAMSSYVFVQSVLDGYDLKMLSVYGISYSGIHLMASEESGISRPGQLEGKVIGFDRNTQYELFFENMLVYYGLDKTQIKTLDTRGRESVELFKNGELDAIIKGEPDHSILLKTFPGEVMAIALDEFMRYNVVYVSSSDFIDKNPDLVKGFLKGANRSTAELSDISSEHMSDLIEATKLPENTLRYALGLVRFELVLDQMLLVTMENQLQWLQDNGYTENQGEFNFLEKIYFEGFDAVKPEANSIIRN